MSSRARVGLPLRELLLPDHLEYADDLVEVPRHDEAAVLPLEPQRRPAVVKPLLVDPGGDPLSRALLGHLRLELCAHSHHLLRNIRE